MKKFVSILAVAGALTAGAVAVIAAQSEPSDNTQIQPKTVAINSAVSPSQSNIGNSGIYDQIMQSQKEMNERMSKFMNDPFFSSRMSSSTNMGSMPAPQTFFASTGVGGYPRTNFFEKDNNYVAQFVIPGMEKENLSVEVNGNIMTVAAKNNADQESNSNNYQSYQSVSRAFTQSINIPNDVDVSKITSNYKNGVLTITLPKDPDKEAQKTVKISVE